MSYVRFNDQHDDGQLTQFRERLSAEVRVQTGEEFPIFQDRADIAWGQNWQRRIDQALDTVTLLLVIITPGFFRSHACRAEVERFLARERDLGRDDLIWPVYYVSTPELDDPRRREADELARVLAARQYADWRELRFEPFTSPVVRRAIAQLATRMRDAFWRPPADGPVHRGEPGRATGRPAEGALPAGGPVHRGEPGRATGRPAEGAERVTAAKATVKTERPTDVVDPYKREVLRRLRAAFKVEASNRAEARTTLREQFKVLLLIRSLQGWPAKVIRIVYYMSLAWAAVWAATGIVETISNFSVEYVIIASLMILIGSGFIPWCLYMLAAHLDRRVRAAAHPPAAQISSRHHHFFKPSSR